MRRNPSSGVAHQGRPGKEKHSIQNSGLHLRYGGAAHDTGRSAVMPPTELSSTRPSDDQAGPADPKAPGERSIHIMADGDLADLEAAIHPHAGHPEAGHAP